MSFVSYMAIMGGRLGLFVNSCSPGNAVFSVPQFHNIILASGFVYGVFWGFMGRWLCMELGCV